MPFQPYKKAESFWEGSDRASQPFATGTRTTTLTVVSNQSAEVIARMKLEAGAADHGGPTLAQEYNMPRQAWLSLRLSWLGFLIEVRAGYRR